MAQGPTPFDFPYKDLPEIRVRGALPLALCTPAYGAFEAALKNAEPPPMKFLLADKEKTGVADAKVTGTLKGLGDYFNDAAATRFILFYENYIDFIRAKAGHNRDRHEQPWRFARIVRNALGHGGTITQDDPNFAPVEWHSFAYGPGDNGRQILGTDMFVPDIFLLMIEMDETLTALGCPN